MSASFSIDYEWLGREHGDALERATLAEISIALNEAHATELHDRSARSVRLGARLGAYHLACWFASNWWRLRWEPARCTASWQMSHKVGAAGGGYVWPDLEFSSDGGSVFIRSHRTQGAPWEPIQYLRDLDAAISPDRYEQAVDGFVGGVLARLASERVKEEDLCTLWKEVLGERQDPECYAWRKLEAILGFDADEAPHELMRAMEEAVKVYGRSAIEEVAADRMDDTPSHLSLLASVKEQELPSVSMPSANEVRSQIAEAGSLGLPWVRAERAAASAREVWSIASGPVTNRMLGNIFEIDQNLIPPSVGLADNALTAGFRDAPDSNGFRVCLGKRHVTSRRFALARLVGDHLVTGPGDRLLPATDAKTERQKLQRAFAQAFLCPFDELQDFFRVDAPTDDTIEDAAAHFEVSPLLIKSTLVNKGVLDRDVLPVY